MKFKGYTDTSDWHPLTLLSMALDLRAWHVGATWRKWCFSFDYAWYDGPIFQWRVGPFWLAITYN